MTKRKKSDWIWVVVAAMTGVFIIWQGLKSISNFLDFSVCGITDTRHLRSPSGDYDLVINEWDCGATVAFFYEYSVVRTGQAPGDGDLFLKIDHGLTDEETFRWEAGDRLKGYIPAGRIWKEKTSVGKVKIDLQFSPKCEHVKQP